MSEMYDISPVSSPVCRRQRPPRRPTGELPRGPAHLPAPDDVDVEVVYRLRAVRPVVDHRAEAARDQSLGPSDRLRCVQQMALWLES